MQSLLRSGEEKNWKKTLNKESICKPALCCYMLSCSSKFPRFHLMQCRVHALIAFNSVPTPLRLLCEQLTHQGRFKEDATSMFTSRVQHPRRSRADCQVDVYDMNERVAGDFSFFPNFHLFCNSKDTRMLFLTAATCGTNTISTNFIFNTVHLCWWRDETWYWHTSHEGLWENDS